MGPDVVDVVLCTWLNFAIPAILTGCDMIPFCESRIDEIERIQSKVAKFALGVPVSCANVCAQTELGMKSFRQQLYERQMKFYFRVLYLPERRWVQQALCEHLTGAWSSPYLHYISSVREKLGLFNAPAVPGAWKRHVFEHFLARADSAASNLPWVRSVTRLSRQPYVSECEESFVISEFKFGCENLGDKQPRDGQHRRPLCPVCPMRAPNTGLHMLFCCSSLSGLRKETGITGFINLCAWKNYSLEETYDLFVNGESHEKSPVPVDAYLERGKCMQDMRALWYSKW